MTVTMSIALLVLRLVVGLTLAVHGTQKLFGWFAGPGLARLMQGFEKQGFKPVWLWVSFVILGEVGGGLSVALGFLTPLGAAEIALADSIGAAVPTDVTARLTAARARMGDVALRAHFHNTRNTGLANAYAAVEAGVGALDASLGGIGGCPFAPNATGNIPTEDLVYLLTRMGIDTGLDLDRLVAIVPWIEHVLDKRVPGLLSKAGVFP